MQDVILVVRVQRLVPFFPRLLLLYSFFFFFGCFLKLYLFNGISPVRNSGCFPRGKPAAAKSRYPTCGACWVFQCFHNPPNSDMDYSIFNVHTDVNACDCARGCTDTVRESALKVDTGRKIPCRTGESNLRQRRAGPTLCQLSCIPVQVQNLGPPRCQRLSRDTPSPSSVPRVREGGEGRSLESPPETTRRVIAQRLLLASTGHHYQQDRIFGVIRATSFQISLHHYSYYYVTVVFTTSL